MTDFEKKIEPRQLFATLVDYLQSQIKTNLPILKFSQQTKFLRNKLANSIHTCYQDNLNVLHAKLLSLSKSSNEKNLELAVKSTVLNWCQEHLKAYENSILDFNADPDSLLNRTIIKLITLTFQPQHLLEGLKILFGELGIIEFEFELEKNFETLPTKSKLKSLKLNKTLTAKKTKNFEALESLVFSSENIQKFFIAENTILPFSALLGSYPWSERDTEVYKEAIDIYPGLMDTLSLTKKWSERDITVYAALMENFPSFTKQLYQRNTWLRHIKEDYEKNQMPQTLFEYIKNLQVILRRCGEKITGDKYAAAAATEAIWELIETINHILPETIKKEFLALSITKKILQLIKKGEECIECIESKLGELLLGHGKDWFFHVLWDPAKALNPPITLQKIKERNTQPLPHEMPEEIFQQYCQKKFLHNTDKNLIRIVLTFPIDFYPVLFKYIQIKPNLIDILYLFKHGFFQDIQRKAIIEALAENYNRFSLTSMLFFIFSTKFSNTLGEKFIALQKEKIEAANFFTELTDEGTQLLCLLCYKPKNFKGLLTALPLSAVLKLLTYKKEKTNKVFIFSQLKKVKKTHKYRKNTLSLIDFSIFILKLTRSKMNAASTQAVLAFFYLRTASGHLMAKYILLSLNEQDFLRYFIPILKTLPFDEIPSFVFKTELLTKPVKHPYAERIKEVLISNEQPVKAHSIFSPNNEKQQETNNLSFAVK